jgi:hypothetical protein
VEVLVSFTLLVLSKFSSWHFASFISERCTRCLVYLCWKEKSSLSNSCQSGKNLVPYPLTAHLLPAVSKGYVLTVSLVSVLFHHFSKVQNRPQLITSGYFVFQFHPLVQCATTCTKLAALWDRTPRSLVHCYQHFGEACCHYLQGRGGTWTLNTSWNPITAFMYMLPEVLFAGYWTSLSVPAALASTADGRTTRTTANLRIRKWKDAVMAYPDENLGTAGGRATFEHCTCQPCASSEFCCYAICWIKWQEKMVSPFRSTAVLHTNRTVVSVWEIMCVCSLSTLDLKNSLYDVTCSPMSYHVSSCLFCFAELAELFQTDSAEGELTRLEIV